MEEEHFARLESRDFEEPPCSRELDFVKFVKVRIKFGGYLQPIALMHDDVLLISSTTKPRIQNPNVFRKERN